MIVILRGPDEVGIERRLRQLKDEADGGTGMLSTNLVVMEGRDAKPGEIVAAALTPPFLAPRRLVVVERLTDRFVPTGNAPANAADAETEAPSRPARQSRTLDAFKPLVEQVQAGLPESTTLVFTGSDDRRNLLADALKGAPGFSEQLFPEMKGDALIRYIREEAGARGVRLRGGASQRPHFESAEWLAKRDADPAALLAGLTQGDTRRIASELDKLALYSMGRDVTVDTVYELCAGEREATVFNLADAMMDGDLVKSFDLLPRVLAATPSEQLLFSTLLGRYRVLALVVELLDENASAEDVAKVMGNAGKFPRLRDDMVRRARRHGQPGVRAAFEALAAADRSIKSGEVKDVEVAIEILVMALAKAATPRAR